MYIDGLTRRLFSYRQFLQNPTHRILNTPSSITLAFEKASLTISAQIGSNLNANSAIECYPISHDNTHTEQSPAPTPETNDTEPASLPRMSLERAHARFGHRALRSLFSGSLHSVWQDYRVRPDSDNYCEGCKISTNRAAARSKRCLYYGSTDQAEKDFEKEVAERFKIEFNGNANWFLQMRIHQYADFSCSIDQFRYTKTISSSSIRTPTIASVAATVPSVPSVVIVIIPIVPWQQRRARCAQGIGVNPRPARLDTRREAPAPPPPEGQQPYRRLAFGVDAFQS